MAKKVTKKAVPKKTVKKATPKKYAFTGESMQIRHPVTDRAVEVRRIYRLSDGHLGGWIEKESNLSHDGECFVHHEAMVFDNARVTANAMILDDAKIYGNARIYGYATVCGNFTVGGDVELSEFCHGKAKYHPTTVSDEASFCVESVEVSITIVKGDQRILLNPEEVRGLYDFIEDSIDV